MLNLNPKEVTGEWDEGYTLDFHTISSTLVGENEFGGPQFDTTYTELGKLLHQMKYNGHYDNTREIVKLCSPFMDNWIANKGIDIIIPIPSSSPTIIQLAEGFSNRYNIPFIPDVLEKVSKEKSKNMQRSDKHIEISMVRSASYEHTVLLLDDLFSTGATANASARALRSDPKIKDIFFLALTRTRT